MPPVGSKGKAPGQGGEQYCTVYRFDYLTLCSFQIFHPSLLTCYIIVPLMQKKQLVKICVLCFFVFLCCMVFLLFSLFLSSACFCFYGHCIWIKMDDDDYKRNTGRVARSGNLPCGQRNAASNCVKVAVTNVKRLNCFCSVNSSEQSTVVSGLMLQTESGLE